MNNAIRIAFLVAICLPATLFAPSSFEDDFNSFGTNVYTEGRALALGFDSWQTGENDASHSITDNADKKTNQYLFARSNTNSTASSRILCVEMEKL